ncbi:lytic murein transglycosylase [Shewanella sp. D64]|uniref:lytic murein transglycosylase n=1 Tax=unclassified Shewanella TaxID=196818 RepID=UPI0022BA669B|nr:MULTISPECIES: lytic murein transglycosylase [unclassified Shewanella]MEC4724805.1 lytic murein transglycosylase [Shewanella sp. D64]MEC4736401.1 lytic murein transglycosylase [Shewanella sp. E94]WBJ97540.1 lytic murein transglycosylase [Shewanella sp. MTB7]
MIKYVPLASLLLFSSLSAPLAFATDFPTCVVELQKLAKIQGLSTDTIENTLGKVTYVARVIELDKKQPEFSQTFDNYFSKRVTDWRVNEGRRLLKENSELLSKLSDEYGIPAQYLMAFWGLETNFGSYKGKMSVLDSLATLACDPRRSQYFTGELMKALKLKEKYQFDASEMVGSWAGAMGHTQFMPSAYTAYAVDGDGDGKADLWNSTTDALTSAANFLQQLGWQRNERWGREVSLPLHFSYEFLGKSHEQTLIKWAEIGVMKNDGKPLSTPDMMATLYLPAGYTGPAFLGYKNFDVIMRWNRSIFYAIAVGHLADRINGGISLTVAPPKQDNLSRNRVKLLQVKLNEKGFDVGKPDGVMGTNSKSGLRQFQRSAGLIADGFPSEASFNALGVQ